MHPYKESLEKKFAETYQKLNPQQRLAVDTIEGPVMVIAGPGTGKTQILAARIGKILLETDALPDNILCLTYTDAGAIAMRRRLQQFIGADAYKVNIYTFHAFCNDVIQDNLYLFEKNSLDAISELETIQLFKTLIDSFPKNHPLKRYRGDVYYETQNLRQLFSNMKREGWTPAYINQKIDEYINELPLKDEFVYKKKYKQFNAGDLKQDKIKEETERMEKLRAAVNEFDHYQQLMRKQNRYDFDDMINWVISVFENNPAVLSQYQERFQYILVDEFQDTSGTQNKLVQLLINYWDQPNVFVVGDDDQSIYRFQGANVENMESFAHNYAASLKTVVLTNNYRSTQPILDVSKSLIDKNNSRLINTRPGLSKNLVSSNAHINHIQHEPIIVEFNSVNEEMAGITNRVEALLAQGVQPGKIAVIYRENKYGEALAAYFGIKGIPLYSKRNINLLQDPFIHKLLQWLSYLHCELDIPYSGDELLFEIMHYSFYGIAPIDIAKITVAVNRQNYADNKSSIRQMLADGAIAPAKNLFDTGMHPSLKQFSHIVETLIAAAANSTLQQLFEQLIQTGGILAYIMKQPQKIELMQMLSSFFDFIKEETARNPMLTLADFIKVVELMQHESIALPMQKVSGSDKGVNLLTAHGSKGLEFEYVFFAGVNASAWEKKRKPSSGYKLPENLMSGLPPADDLEELRRLFYVALTRAETHLHLSFAKYKDDGKEMEPSIFVAEILEAHPQIHIQSVALSADEIFAFNLLQFNSGAPQIAQTEEEFINALLEKFVMNVTALNNYLKCPLQFYYQNLIRIPSGRSEATEFGSAIHYALEKLFRNMLDGGKNQFDPPEELIANFRWYMRKHREHFTREAFDRRMEYGEEVLHNYYTTYINNWPTIVTVERSIRGVMINNVPLKGKMDKLEFDGNHVNVVDYKTGNIANAASKLKGPNDKEPNGGDYWRQAVFYKLLIDHYPQKNWQVVSTEFDFVEPDNKKEYRKVKIVISPADTETVKQQLTDTWQKIKAKDFYTGCGKPDCHWCNFVKDNQLQIALHQAPGAADSDD